MVSISQVPLKYFFTQHGHGAGYFRKAQTAIQWLGALFGDKTDPGHSVLLQTIHDDFHDAGCNCQSSRLWPDHNVLNIGIACPVAYGSPHPQNHSCFLNRYHKAVTAGNDSGKLLKGVSELRPPACKAVEMTDLKEIILLLTIGEGTPALI